MKYIITESQYKLLTEEKILELDFDVFNYDWNLLQRFLDKKGNPPYKIIGDLDLYGADIESLGNLQSVGGYLDLNSSEVKSLGNLKSVGGYLDLARSKIESLGNLKYVGRDLNLCGSKIKSLGNLESVGGILFLTDCTNLKSLGNLQSVGDHLYMHMTPLSKTTTKEEIRNQVGVGGDINF